jgi:hypothetical protein
MVVVQKEIMCSILDIVQTSQLRTNSKTLDGGMHLDIIARVEGIMYEPGEIIPDVRIAKITDTLAIAASKYASININIGRVNILKVGDLTPVVVRLAQYNKYTDKIAIAANLFLPPKPTLQLLIGNGENKNDTEIDVILNKIKECNKKIAALDTEAKKSLAYFNKLIYPYAKPVSWGKSLSLNGLNGDVAELALTKTPIGNLNAEKKYNVFLPDNNYLDDTVYFAETKDKHIMQGLWNVKDETLLVMEFEMGDLYKNVLARHYKQLYTLLQLVESYPNKELLANSLHIWKFYEMNLPKAV